MSSAFPTNQEHGRTPIGQKSLDLFSKSERQQGNPLANQKCNIKSIKVEQGKGGISSQTDGSYETARTINAMSRVEP